MTTVINPAAFRVVHNRPYTSSLAVAEYFEKEHKNVLRQIDELCTQVPDFLLKLNFEPKEKMVKTGVGTERKSRYFLIDQKAFTILVMGFTGEKALRFKLAFYDEFERMQKALTASAAPALLDSKDAQRIRRAVGKRAEKTRARYAAAYQALAQHFGVSTYREIPADRIDEAIAFLDTVELPPAALPAPAAADATPQAAEDVQALAKRVATLEKTLSVFLREVQDSSNYIGAAAGIALIQVS